MSRLPADLRWKLPQDTVRESTRPNQPAPLFAAVDAAPDRVVGHKLFTLMALDHVNGEGERIHTNHPIAYPVSGRKQMAATLWFKQVIPGRQHYPGRTGEDLRWAFVDHGLIERLGCRSVINVLAIYDDVVIGSAKLPHEEHYHIAHDIRDCLPFVQSLVPAFGSRTAAN